MDSFITDLAHPPQFHLADYQGWQMPAYFGDIAVEIAAVRRGAALRDTSHWGRIAITGADQIDFLHRMTTNHFLQLQEGAGLEAVFTENRGRILDLGTFYRRDGELLILLGPEAPSRIIPWLDRFLFSEKVELRDITAETAMLELCGPEASAIVAETLGQSPAAISPHQLFDAATSSMWLARLDRFGHPGLRAAGPREEVASLWERLHDTGAIPLGEEAWEVLRIEEGLPVYGRELTDEYNPWEAGLERAIHMDKGCYIGQEVIARLDAYDKVKQHLVGLSWPSSPLPPAGTELAADGKSAGKITSATYSPERDRHLALAYVRKAYCEPGTRLTFTAGSVTCQAEVVDLPFPPGA